MSDSVLFAIQKDLIRYFYRLLLVSTHLKLFGIHFKPIVVWQDFYAMKPCRSRFLWKLAFFLYSSEIYIFEDFPSSFSSSVFLDSSYSEKFQQAAIKYWSACLICPSASVIKASFTYISFTQSEITRKYQDWGISS